MPACARHELVPMGLPHKAKKTSVELVSDEISDLKLRVAKTSKGGWSGAEKGADLADGAGSVIHDPDGDQGD